jgi:hypothetical protein
MSHMLRHVGKSQHKREVVIRRDTVMSLDPARQTAVHHRMLAAGTDEHADGCHRAATRAEPVARHALVHMTRVQTDGTMVAMPPASRHDADKRVTVTAPKLLIPPRSRASHGGALARLRCCEIESKPRSLIQSSTLAPNSVVLPETMVGVVPFFDNDVVSQGCSSVSFSARPA